MEWALRVKVTPFLLCFSFPNPKRLFSPFRPTTVTGFFRRSLFFSLYTSTTFRFVTGYLFFPAVEMRPIYPETYPVWRLFFIFFFPSIRRPTTQFGPAWSLFFSLSAGRVYWTQILYSILCHPFYRLVNFLRAGSFLAGPKGGLSSTLLGDCRLTGYTVSDRSSCDVLTLIFVLN